MGDTLERTVTDPSHGSACKRHLLRRIRLAANSTNFTFATNCFRCVHTISGRSHCASSCCRSSGSHRNIPNTNAGSKFYCHRRWALPRYNGRAQRNGRQPGCLQFMERPHVDPLARCTFLRHVLVGLRSHKKRLDRPTRKKGGQERWLRIPHGPRRGESTEKKQVKKPGKP